MAKIRIVVDVEGGLVQGVYTDLPELDIEVAVVDLDIEGADEEDILKVDQGDIATGPQVTEFTGAIHGPGEAREYVKRVFEVINDRDRRYWAEKEKREATNA
jgi:hypothetical protein